MAYGSAKPLNGSTKDKLAMFTAHHVEGTFSAMTRCPVPCLDSSSLHAAQFWLDLSTALPFESVFQVMSPSLG